MVYIQINKHTNNLPHILLTGQFLDQLTTGISFTCNQNQQLLRRLMIYIRLFVQYGKYAAIDTTETTKNGFYVIMFISEAYTLQNNTAIDGHVISAG